MEYPKPLTKSYEVVRMAAEPVKLRTEAFFCRLADGRLLLQFGFEFRDVGFGLEGGETELQRGTAKPVVSLKFLPPRRPRFPFLLS